jgi:hypothetical protein
LVGAAATLSGKKILKPEVVLAQGSPSKESTQFGAAQPAKI